MDNGINATNLPSIYPLTKIGTIASILNLALPLLMILGTIIFLCMLLWAAFSWITAGGDPKNLEKVQKTITYAIMGLVVILVSYTAVKLVGRILNIQLPF